MSSERKRINYVIKIERESTVGPICFHEVINKLIARKKRQEGDIDTFVTKDTKQIHHNFIFTATANPDNGRYTHGHQP